MANIQGCKSMKRQGIGLHTKSRVFSDFHWKVEYKILQDPVLQVKKSEEEHLKDGSSGSTFWTYFLNIPLLEIQKIIWNKKNHLSQCFSLQLWILCLILCWRKKEKNTFFNIVINKQQITVEYTE